MRQLTRQDEETPRQSGANATHMYSWVKRGILTCALSQMTQSTRVRCLGSLPAAPGLWLNLAVDCMWDQLAPPAPLPLEALSPGVVLIGRVRASALATVVTALLPSLMRLAQVCTRRRRRTTHMQCQQHRHSWEEARAVLGRRRARGSVTKNWLRINVTLTQKFASSKFARDAHAKKKIARDAHAKFDLGA